MDVKFYTGGVVRQAGLVNTDFDEAAWLKEHAERGPVGGQARESRRQQAERRRGVIQFERGTLFAWFATNSEVNEAWLAKRDRLNALSAELEIIDSRLNPAKVVNLQGELPGDEHEMRVTSTGKLYKPSGRTKQKQAKQRHRRMALLEQLSELPYDVPLPLKLTPLAERVMARESRRAS